MYISPVKNFSQISLKAQLGQGKSFVLPDFNRFSVSFSSSVYSSHDSAIKTIRTIKSRKGAVPNIVEHLASDWALTPDKKSLPIILVHKNIYSALEDCKTLEEAKRKFPQFKDVKSISEINYMNGSTLDLLSKGIVSGFEKDDDIALKFLKYYWCDLISPREFSVNFRNKITGYPLDFENSFKKLNIPKMDKEYALALRIQKMCND